MQEQEKECKVSKLSKCYVTQNQDLLKSKLKILRLLMTCTGKLFTNKYYIQSKMVALVLNNSAKHSNH